MKYHCHCQNFQIEWDVNLSNLVARQCGCDYCRSCKTEYMSDPNSKLSFKVTDDVQQKIIQHGFNTAKFHECGNCGLILVTSEIEGEIYAVVNVSNLNIEGYRIESDYHDFSNESSEVRLARRKKNWCKVVD